jgi:hypothetical protein
LCGDVGELIRKEGVPEEDEENSDEGPLSRKGIPRRRGKKMPIARNVQDKLTVAQMLPETRRFTTAREPCSLEVRLHLVLQFGVS